MQPDPHMEAAVRRWLHDGTHHVKSIGDGDPREYGGTLPDGRRWAHPPYGPAQIMRTLFPIATKPAWWRRLLWSRSKDNESAVCGCPLRTDGTEPYVHRQSCPRAGDLQVERWLREDAP